MSNTQLPEAIDKLHVVRVSENNQAPNQAVYVTSCEEMKKALNISNFMFEKRI